MSQAQGQPFSIQEALHGRLRSAQHAGTPSTSVFSKEQFLEHEMTRACMHYGSKYAYMEREGERERERETEYLFRGPKVQK